MKLQIIEKNNQIFIEDIKELESKYNILLSDEYKEFLLNINGGKPNSNMAFNSIDKFIEPFTIMEFYDIERLDEILEYVKNDTEEFLLNGEDPLNVFYLCSENKMIEIGETYSDWCIYICYSEKNFGEVYCADLTHDDGFTLLSNSFYDFINNFEFVTNEELETGNFKFLNK